MCCLQDGTALSLDLLGSCFSDQLRPPTLMPHHLTQYLHQGRSSAALRAGDSSPGMTQGQGLPAAALDTQSRMASAVAVTAGYEQRSGRESELDTVGAALRLGASTVELPSQDNLMAFSGKDEVFFLLPLPRHFPSLPSPRQTVETFEIWRTGVGRMKPQACWMCVYSCSLHTCNRCGKALFLCLCLVWRGTKHSRQAFVPVQL